MTQNSKIPSTEELRSLGQLLHNKYGQYIDDKTFLVEAKLENEFVYATVTLKNQDCSFYYPVETRIDFKKEELSVNEATLFLIDYIDSYFEAYITEDEDLFLNIDWTEHNYSATSFQIKGQILNQKLENLADELLKDHS